MKYTVERIHGMLKGILEWRANDSKDTPLYREIEVLIRNIEIYQEE